MRRWFFTTCAHAARVRRFWALGDKERALGVPISPLCDREKDMNVPKSQVGFFKFICLPFYAVVADLVEPNMVAFQRLQENLRGWQRKLAKQPTSPTPPKL